MGDVDTFLTILYVTVDDFCKYQSLPEPTPGPQASLAEDFFAFRHTPHPRLPTLGEPALGWYVADKGFAGQVAGQRRRDRYGAWVICPPQRNSRNPWPKALRRWLAAIRQIVETVFDKLHHTFALDREGPHQLDGFQTRLAAKVALHNFCIWLNRQVGRPALRTIAKSSHIVEYDPNPSFPRKRESTVPTLESYHDRADGANRTTLQSSCPALAFVDLLGW